MLKKIILINIFFLSKILSQEILEHKEKYFFQSKHIVFHTKISYNHLLDNSLKLPFSLDEARLDFKGTITNRTSYMIRYRIHRNNIHFGGIKDGGDNSSSGLDVSFIEYKLGDFNFSFGKMWMIVGGVEFEPNPIRIFQYSDFLMGMNPFLVGVGIDYIFKENHLLKFQILNSDNKILHDNINNIRLDSSLSISKMPLTLSFNIQGKISLIEDKDFFYNFSYNNISDIKNKYVHLLMGGVKFNFKKNEFWFDTYYSNQDYDKYSYVSTILKDNNLYEKISENSTYITFLTKIKYCIYDNIFFSTKLIYENSYTHDANVGIKGLLRTKMTYYGILEYNPLNDDNNFTIYLGYIGNYNIINKVITNNEIINHLFTFGGIYSIPII